MYPLLIKSVMTHDLTLFKTLYKKEDFDPSFDENWILRISSKLGLFSIVKLVIEHEKFKHCDKVDIAIFLTVYSSNLDVLKYLIESPKINSDWSKIAIEDAIEYHKIDCLSILCQTEKQLSTLKKFSENGYKELMKFNNIKNF